MIANVYFQLFVHAFKNYHQSSFDNHIGTHLCIFPHKLQLCVNCMLLTITDAHYKCTDYKYLSFQGVKQTRTVGHHIHTHTARIYHKQNVTREMLMREDIVTCKTFTQHSWKSGQPINQLTVWLIPHMKTLSNGSLARKSLCFGATAFSLTCFRLVVDMLKSLLHKSYPKKIIITVKSSSSASLYVTSFAI